MTNAVNIAQSGTNNVTMRNRIINGAMMIDQRNAGASVNTDGAFPVDRWKQNMSGGGVITGQRSAVAPAGFVNSLSQTVSTADSSIASGDYYFLTQNIEGFNVADFGWGTANAQAITISFQVRSSVTGTYTVAVGNSAFSRLYVATYTINSANTFEYKTITIPGDTTGTWLTDNAIGLRLYFDLGSGSSYNASSSGAWLGTGLGIRVAGSVNWISNSGATFYITGVQLEEGTAASPFENRLITTEQLLCQRYYQTNYPVGTAVGTASGISVAMGKITASSSWGEWVHTNAFVLMRATPTTTVYNPTNGTAGQYRNYSAGTNVTITFNGNQTTSVVLGSLEPIPTSGQLAFLFWAASAEL